MTDELDFQIHSLFRRVADAAPPAPDLNDWPIRSHSARRGRIVAMSAAAVLATLGLAGVAVVVGRGDQGAAPPDDGPSASTGVGPREIGVDYEHMVYRQSADLACADPISSAGGFNRAKIEAFADRTGQRWANRITYPDGSHRDVIAIGDAFYPQRVAERGEWRGAELGCHYDEGDLILTAEPAQGYFYSLNPLDDIPLYRGESMVPGYRELGSRVDGAHRPVGGWGSTELWRQEIDGSWDVGGARNVPGTQVTEWFVDPGTGAVVKWRFTTSVEGVGTSTQSVTMVEWGGILYSDDMFNDAGYRTLPAPEDPRRQDSDGRSTIEPTVPSPVSVHDICDTYTVRAGDYPVGVAESFGITYEELVAANPNFDEVFVLGEMIAIPCQ